MISFSTKSFDELSLLELYNIMRLRQEVFVVEQDCPYLDADGKDQASFHVLGTDTDGVLHAYTRLVPAGISYDHHTSIGRVVTSGDVRKTGIGKSLMKYSIKQIQNLWPGLPVKISAQSYLLKFYSELGFQQTGVEYLEDGIPHTAMILSA